VGSELIKLYFTSRSGYHGFHELLRIFSYELPYHELFG